MPTQLPVQMQLGQHKSVSINLTTIAWGRGVPTAMETALLSLYTASTLQDYTDVTI